MKRRKYNFFRCLIWNRFVAIGLETRQVNTEAKDRSYLQNNIRHFFPVVKFILCLIIRPQFGGTNGIHSMVI